MVKAMNGHRERFVRRFGTKRLQTLSSEEQKSKKEAIAYEVRGDLITWCCREIFAGRDYDGIAAEFGTYGPISVLSALRAENQAHHWGTPDSPPTRCAKSRLREVFAPESPEWRAETVAKGVDIVQRTIDDVHEA